MSIKIMYLLEYPLDLPGGAQMSTQAVCEGMLEPKGEFAPVVVTPALLSKQPSDYAFALRQYPMGEKRVKNLLLRLRAFASIIKQERPDIIHAQMPESLITFGLLRTFGIGRGSRLLYTDRGLYFGYRRHSLSAIRHTLRYVDAMVLTTRFNEGLWQQKEKLPYHTVIANTISSSFTPYSEEQRLQARRRAGLSPEDFVIAFAGRVCEEKGWPRVPELAALLKQKGVRCKAAIVMSVYEPGDDEVVRQVREGLAVSLGQENLMIYQDLSQQEMADFYYLADVFVMTSCFESFGKAAVEAMSRRCAVISTDVGGLPEVIGRQENLYGENDLEKAAARIALLASEKELLDKEKEYFYNRYCENFTLKEYLEKHRALYRKVLREEM